MLKYDKLWVTRARLLRKNMVVKTMILNRLCSILDCRIEDIVEYVPDDTDTK